MKGFILVPAFICSLITVGQDVSFYRENITMMISGRTFYVTGLYYLRSDCPENIFMAYPFPTKKLYGIADSILIIDLTDGSEIMPLRSDSATLTFPVDFLEGKEKLLQISYQQALNDNQAEYILKSTRAWQKPLEEAHYQLIIPQTLTVTRFSIPPMDSLSAGSEKIYTWDMTNYMPTVNMVFDFVTGKDDPGP